VSIERRPAAGLREICDDGWGVNVVGRKLSGLGLRSMQYRASMAGGLGTSCRVMVNCGETVTSA